MSFQQAITAALGIILLNLLIGHFFAPTGIMITPVILIASTALIVFNTRDKKPVLMSLLVLLMIILNDIGLKLYAGGAHDKEGQAWVHFMLFLGLIPSFFIMTRSILKSEEFALEQKIVSIFLFPLVISAHLFFFSDLGIGRYFWYDWN